MSTPPFDEAAFTRKRVEAICERALQQAGVAGVFPTPLGEVAQLAGITEVIDLADLPHKATRPKPRLWRKILGVLDFRSRAVFVDRNQSGGRVRWTEAHETVHALLPWHEASSFLDDDESLFRQSEEARELEANIGAGHLLFQGSRYMDRAASLRPSIAAPIQLAPEVGASMHSSIRYYTEHHPEPAALLVGGRYQRSNGHVPVLLAVESPPFRDQFGPAQNLMPSGTIPVADGAEPKFLRDAALQALHAPGSVELPVTIRNRDGDGKEFMAELFTNGYSLFVFMLPKRRVRLGKLLHLVDAPGLTP